VGVIDVVIDDTDDHPLAAVDGPFVGRLAHVIRQAEERRRVRRLLVVDVIVEGANEAWLGGDLLEVLLCQPRGEAGEDGPVGVEQPQLALCRRRRRQEGAVPRMVGPLI
jgi:hypothetical protein